jgi:iron complex transport system permease protein
VNRLITPLLALALLLAALASLASGEVWLRPQDFAGAQHDLAWLIIVEVRLPRLLLGIAVGGVLGLSGAVLQGLLRNPLAEPGILGVSAGASLGAVIAIYYGFAAMTALAAPVFGLAGALLTGAIALALARQGGTLALILAGSAMAAIAAAGVSLALNLAPDPYAAYEISTWLMGSLADRSWDHVWLAMPFIVAGAALLFACGPAMELLALGEAQAESLGVDLRRTRLLALVGTAAGVGAATAVSGAIGFVGLIAPHLVRHFVDHRPARVLLPATLAGALVVTIADIGTRLLSFGPEIRLGVLISLVGAPFFLWLILYVRRTAP